MFFKVNSRKHESFFILEPQRSVDDDVWYNYTSTSTAKTPPAHCSAAEEANKYNTLRGDCDSHFVQSAMRKKRNRRRTTPTLISLTDPSGWCARGCDRCKRRLKSDRHASAVFCKNSSPAVHSRSASKYPDTKGMKAIVAITFRCRIQQILALSLSTGDSGSRWLDPHAIHASP